MDQGYAFSFSRSTTSLRKLLHFIQHKTFRLGRHYHKTSSGLHIDIQTPMEERIYQDIFVEGDYDQAIDRLLVKDQPGRNVLDLGSNVGMFIFRLIDLSIQRNKLTNIFIQGVDANSDLCSELVRRTSMNNIPASFHINITCGLIGALNGEGTLYQFKDHGLSSVFREKGKATSVSFVNLSKLTQDWSQIDLLKCDIEGSEENFVRNYPELLQRTQCALFEYHTEYVNHDECRKLINDAGLIQNKLIRQNSHSIIELFWR